MPAANPDAEPLVDPTPEVMPSAIDPFPDRGDDPTNTLPPDTTNDDVPMDFPPRSPSPEMPDLKRRPFPPDEASDSESDDDEIAATLPIYMCANLFPNIQMFQYPLHTNTIQVSDWAYDRGKRITTRVKENIGKVEVEIPIDGGTDVWRYDRASELGYTQDVNDLNGDADLMGGYEGPSGSRGKNDKKKKDKKDKKDKKWGDKMRLRSEPVPSATGYYSGQIFDGALHLHPISRYNQLRTSLQYLDEPKKTDKYDDDEDGRAPVRTAGTVPVHRNIKHDEENDGTGSIKDFRNKMWSMAQKELEDEWVPYEWKEGNDPDVLDKLEKMLVDENKQKRLKCKSRPLDYLDMQ